MIEAKLLGHPHDFHASSQPDVPPRPEHFEFILKELYTNENLY